MSEVATIEQLGNRKLDEIAAELPSETGELVEYILARYHETHRRQLPELIRLSRKVEQVHAGKPGVPAGLADILQTALGELEVHMRKEELMIFPAMCRAGSERRFDGPTAMLREDHESQTAVLGEIARLTDDFTPPESACNTWRALYAAAAEFSKDLVEHIHVENNVLFPRFESGSVAA
jgi:regulator of cell morphogenesis and NO signaling